ncbi:hypothetical protein MettiDRAFT_1930 [Methanolobus tindarius DSM 2278]|uniref:Uncharacterized protein n=1 Tax=Methanolobus tindarius DSM 2278 TaxID=1090322 RepID=W9DPX5_METTI|nr:ribbon-helix-helix domain-containing protein [Methanolobus tindarius]ETA68459.1 hypothetical protein MettiDRAFT_1930 [Methanolobus tindarius DSM 2278]
MSIETTTYSKVSIPNHMRDEIERIIENDKRLGFVSIQEFVKEAIRRSIIQYGGISDQNPDELDE